MRPASPGYRQLLPASMAVALVFVAPTARAAADSRAWLAPSPAALTVAQAEAEPEPAPAEPAAPAYSPPPSSDTHSHQYQFGLSLMPGTGYRMIVPYSDPDKGNECGEGNDAGARVCAARSPVFLDLGASFGVSRRLDLILDLRLGIEEDFTRSRQFALMPGLRVWMDEGVALKLFASIQGVWDNTRQRGSVDSNDFGFRPALGLMYDVIRNLGIYGQLGATFGLVRWLRIEADVGLGVQVRFP